MTAMRPPTTPFSNGTEAEAWMSRWCSYCVHDHGLHDDAAQDETDTMCRLIADAMLGGPEWRWPEAWTPEPPGMYGLLSYMLCGSFKPCAKDACTGDPAPTERAERVTMVQLAWAATR